MSTAFLQLNSLDNNCLLCEKDVIDKTGSVTFTDKGWANLKANAEKWRKVDFPADDPFYLFPSVHQKICNAKSAFGWAHQRCRITFSTKFDAYKYRYGMVPSDEKSSIVSDEKKAKSPSNTMDTRNTAGKLEGVVCFICNVKKNEDKKPYNEGGLGSCFSSEEKMKERTKVYISDQDYEYHQAACRFVRQSGGLDSSTEKISYHQKCYIR